MGAHIRPQKRISEAKSHGTAVPWLFLRRNLFYAEHTPSSGSVQAQRSRFDLSWYLFLRCATVPARFRFRPFGRACLPLIPDAPDCICSPGHLWFWVVWASCLGAAAPISIHAPRVGRDESGDSIERLAQQFQSTRPVWGATGRCGNAEIHREISIHAPRVGRDAPAAAQGFHCRNFNPRAPCGARHIAAAPDHKHTQFQSTRPVWGATCCILRRHSLAPNFNPRAPCGTRRDRRAARCALHRISIHAPRVGRDALAPGVFTEGYISIHAPRVGRDYIDREAAIEICISIHAPRVGRDCAATITRCWRQISIHAPRVGRDQELTPDAHRTSISIHAPRVGRDALL